MVQNLVIACYAIQADKAWLRAGQPMPTPPKLDKITDDMVLRSQELPTEEEFDAASARAQGIFRHPAAAGAQRPVGPGAWPSIRRNAGGPPGRGQSRWPPSSTGTRRRSAWPTTPPRMATSARAHRAAGAAGRDHRRHADRPRAGRRRAAQGERHLPGAPGQRRDALTPVLRQVNWQVLDDLAAARRTTPRPPRSSSALRQAARHDEHEVALAAPLRKADADAIALFMERARTPDPAGTRRMRHPACRQHRPARLPDLTGRRQPAEPVRGSLAAAAGTRVRARDVPGVRREDLRGGRREPGGGVRDHLADRDR